MKKLLLCFVVLVLFFGCNENSQSIDDHSHGNTATITITSPQEGASFNKNDTIKFIGTILSKENIHGFTLNFLKKNSIDTLFSYNNHSHNDTVIINTFWVNNVTQLTDAEAIIIVALDHDGNTAIKKIGCRCKP